LHRKSNNKNRKSNNKETYLIVFGITKYPIYPHEES